MKKFMQFAFAAGSLVAIAPIAASSQEMLPISMVQAAAELQDPQWAAMHADESQANPADYARDWRLYESQRIIRLEEGGA